jgi:glucosyl-dolichyl phosphate glucuronosyltransferase
MKATIGICTWNRSRLLDRTLARMASIRVPEGVTWELIVANNNCTDDTDAVLARHAKRLPLRRLFVAKPGKSNAANSIVAEAAGELILWTDDDVLVEPQWLEAYVAAAMRYKDVDIFGGLVLPEFEQRPPRWIARNLPMFWGIFGTCNHGSEQRLLLKKKEILIGANMAVRRHLHLTFPFDTRIGPQPGSEIRGEDTLLVLTARIAGHQVAWVPDAVVHHHVPAIRMTRRYMRDYWRAIGAERILLEEQPECVYLFGIPRWLWKSQMLAWFRAALVRLGGRSPTWFRHVSEAEILRGMAQQFRKMRCNRV